MQVSLELSLTEQEEGQLRKILSCNEGEDLATVFSRYATAACEEYARMFLGQKVFTRGADFREYRLLLLVQRAFEGRIPVEQRICDLFQITAAQARSLVRAVISKYQYDLKEAIEATMRLILEAAETVAGHIVVTIDNESMIDALNRLVTSISGDLPPISKKHNTVSQYSVPKSTYLKLCEALQLTPIDFDEDS